MTEVSIHIDGRRANACLAVAHNGAAVTPISFPACLTLDPPPRG